MSTTNPSSPSGLDAEALYGKLAQQVKSGLQGVSQVAIVGIHSGGAWLAERLATELQLTQRLGFIDVSFYRSIPAAPRARPSMNCSTTVVRRAFCWPRWSIAAAANCRLRLIFWPRRLHSTITKPYNCNAPMTADFP
jgi:hypothetical protein